MTSCEKVCCGFNQAKQAQKQTRIPLRFCCVDPINFDNEFCFKVWNSIFLERSGAPAESHKIMIVMVHFSLGFGLLLVFNAT